MEEIQFTIGDEVKIKANGFKGKVYEIWMTKEAVKYNVKFADTSGRIISTICLSIYLKKRYGH